MLTVKEIQNELKIGRDRAYSLVRSKGFPAIKIGARFYVTEEALKKWLEKNEGREIKL